MAPGLVELWIAKKTLLFLSARAYGFKPLYRRCLELNNRVFAPGRPMNQRSQWFIRHSFDAVLNTAIWADTKARQIIVSATGKEPPPEAVAKMSGKKPGQRKNSL